MTFPDPEALARYLGARFRATVREVRLTPLGETRHAGAEKGYGYGVPLLVEFDASGTRRRVVLETTSPGPFGHEHMADRAQMMLWDHGAYNRLPRHARSLDVGAFRSGADPVSLGDAEEFFLLVEYVEGRPYVEDLARIRESGALGPGDRARADALCDYLAGIHSVRGGDPGLYVRRIRELLGHGECILGIVDSYPSRHGFLTAERLERIEHRCLAWRWKLRGRTHRLRQVHGDFHPYNILFRSGEDFSVLDRSRGEWGDPADDVASITGNYLFAALQSRDGIEGPFGELFRRFWDRYLGSTGDREILEVIAPFYAFRGLVMASPVWYPALDESVRRSLFRFLEAVLDADSFDPGRLPGYLRG